MTASSGKTPGRRRPPATAEQLEDELAVAREGPDDPVHLCQRDLNGFILSG